MAGQKDCAGSINLQKNVKFLTTAISRGSLRGFKRCPDCGKLNGVRSTVCRNENCKLRKNLLQLQIPLDPMRLESLDNGKALYSIRSKEQNANPRNFVLSTITNDITTSFICYCCGQPSLAGTTICKHITACVERNAVNAPTQAEVFSISRDVLWTLNGLDEEHKQSLWATYEQEVSGIPAVQRISNAMFVVRCDVSKMFPAGRLHVTALRNGISTKKGIYSCACKKLKIIVEQDNSVVMKEEVCDHILLVLAAVLSNRKGKTAYGNFTSALKSYWMPTGLETPIVDSTQEDALFGLSIDIGGNFDMERCESGHVDDIFIYNNDFMSNENIPDFEDIILNYPLNAADHLQSINAPASNATMNSNEMLRPGDPNLGLSFAIADAVENVKDAKFRLNALNAEISDLDAGSNFTTAHLELSDCKIELMDQFELTDQIDLSTTDDITLKPEETWLGNGISILEAPVLNSAASTTAECNAVSPIIETSTGSTTAQSTTFYNNTNSLLKVNQVVEALPIELPTIAVVKKCPVKTSELVNKVNTRKFPPIPAKRSLIINETGHAKQEQQSNKEVLNCEEPSLAFSAWLDYVIEVINESISIEEERNVEHTFHVHEEIFAHFSKTLSNSIKLRMPHSTTVVKAGKHKGLLKYAWYFTNASTVRRIFSTKNISLETERIFECNRDGVFVPYVIQPAIPSTNGKLKKVFPKLSLYKAQICLESGISKNQRNSFKIEWLPSAFPKSHHGILKLQFSINVQNPVVMQNLINRK